MSGQSNRVAPTISTSAGTVSGVQRPDSAAYLGVPFAAPPTGERRFLAPQPPVPWHGVRACDASGPTPQRRPFGDVTTIPEPSNAGDDTLNVNVFTPAPGDRDALQPVLVWVHGGGYFAGSPASPWYDGRSFARDGVVTVVLSYRLGFDGFGWIDGAPLNRGLLDQIAALEWVRDNIRGFGGDPARVTIAGQSAGGGSVLALLTSPRAAGLFRGAISQSGAAGALSAAGAERTGRRFAAAIGVSPDLSGWRSLTEDQILDRQTEFNQVPDVPGMASPPTELIAAARRTPAGSLPLAFAPVVDDEIVLAPVEAIRAGAGAEVPLLLGATRNEFAFPIPGAASVHEIVAAASAAGCTEAAVARYRLEVDRLGPAYAASQLAVAQMFRAPAVHVGAERSRQGAGQRTWLYDFAHHSAVDGTSSHCYDLPFSWDVLDAPGVERVLGAEPPQQLADRMHADWVRFITDGTVGWPAVAEAPIGAARVYGDEPAFDESAYGFEVELTGDQ